MRDSEVPCMPRCHYLRGVLQAEPVVKHALMSITTTSTCLLDICINVLYQCPVDICINVLSMPIPNAIVAIITRRGDDGLLKVGKIRCLWEGSSRLWNTSISLYSHLSGASGGYKNAGPSALLKYTYRSEQSAIF